MLTKQLRREGVGLLRDWSARMTGGGVGAAEARGSSNLVSRPVNRRSSSGAVFVGLAALVAFGTVLLSFPLRDLLSGRVPIGVTLVGAVGLAVAIGLHVWVVVRVCRLVVVDRRMRWVAMTESLIFLLLLLTMNDQDWIAVPLFGVSDLLLVTAGRVRLLSVGSMVAVYVLLCARTLGAADLPGNLLTFVVATAFCYGIAGLVRAARELDAAGAELAHAAIGAERLRVARDLHDTLGHSITVALLKLELAERLSKHEVERGMAEAVEAKDLLRSAMQELQAVVAGIRDLSPRREVDSAASVLESAGIAVTASVVGDELTGEVADAACWVIREATTNVLRHSRATRCRITLDCQDGMLELRIVNDGVAAPNGSISRPGSKGLVGMRERMAAVGGSLSSGLDDAGDFVLHTSAPQPSGTAS